MSTDSETPTKGDENLQNDTDEGNSPSPNTPSDEGTDVAVRIDEQGERITETVTEIIAQRRVDSEVAQQLHGDLGSQLRKLTHEHEEVTVAEVAVALWSELEYIVEVIEEANQDTDEGETGTADEDGDGAESAERSSSALFSDDEKVEEPPTDPAFH